VKPNESVGCLKSVHQSLHDAVDDDARYTGYPTHDEASATVIGIELVQPIPEDEAQKQEGSDANQANQ